MRFILLTSTLFFFTTLLSFGTRRVDINQTTGLVTNDRMFVTEQVTLPQLVTTSTAPAGGYRLNFSWGANNGSFECSSLNINGGCTVAVDAIVIVNGVRYWVASTPNSSSSLATGNHTENGALFISGAGNWRLNCSGHRITNTAEIVLPTSVTSINSVSLRLQNNGRCSFWGPPFLYAGSDDAELRLNSITVDNGCSSPSPCTVISSQGNTINVGQSSTFSVNGGIPSNGTTWSISPNTGVSQSTGTSVNTGAITFSNPGVYTIQFNKSNNNVPAGCLTPSTTACSAFQIRVDGAVATEIDADNEIMNIAAGQTSALSVIANDSLDNAPAVIGTGLGQVSLSSVSLPTGFTLLPDGRIRTANTVAQGLYQVVYNICQNGTIPINCDEATATVFVTAPVGSDRPDYSLSLRLLGRAEVNSATDTVNLLIDVSELDGVASRTGSPVEVQFPRSEIILLPYSASASSIEGETIQNGNWTFDNSNAQFYIFRYTGNAGVFPASTRSPFGISVRIPNIPTTPTNGFRLISGFIVNGAGGEDNSTNNQDEESVIINIQ